MAAAATAAGTHDHVPLGGPTRRTPTGRPFHSIVRPFHSITGDAEGAARWWQERGCSYEAAMALAGSRDQAALRRALDTSHELGSRPAAALVARRLRALGEQSVPRGPRPATAANPAGLTSRQAEVLELLTAGLSNTQIAAQLVLSGRTVDHNVAAILRKLGAHTRGEASAQAARLGLTGPRPPAAGATVTIPAH